MVDLDSWFAPPFEEGRWHRLCEWLDRDGSTDVVAELLARMDAWPDQHLAAVKEWNHNELGAHGLRELLLWHWLSVPSKQQYLRLVAGLRLFGQPASETVGAELAEVSELISLEALSLRNCDLDAEGLARFLGAASSDASLRYLELRGNALRTAELVLLAAMPRLKHLDLRVNPNLWDRPSLGRLPAGLESLLLENTGLDDMAMRAIAGDYPNLEVIGLSNNVFTDDGVEEFFQGSSLPALVSAYFGEARITHRSLETLVDAGVAHRLDELMLVGADLSELPADVLPQFESLRTVALIDCQLGADTLETWLRSPAGERIEWMDLSGRDD